MPLDTVFDYGGLWAWTVRAISGLSLVRPTRTVLRTMHQLDPDDSLVRLLLANALALWTASACTKVPSTDLCASTSFAGRSKQLGCCVRTQAKKNHSVSLITRSGS